MHIHYTIPCKVELYIGTATVVASNGGLSESAANHNTQRPSLTMNCGLVFGQYLTRIFSAS